ncbi:hypothetical protein FRC08_017266 [Ceratobasidium sp. 394]|nr:hypothetical protein FRC08_017266 [Ceratobasidium sp. 394]
MAHYALGGDFVPWFQHRAKVHRLHWALTLFNPSHNLVSNDTESIFDVDPSDLEDDRFTPEVVFEDAAPTSPLCNPSMTGFTMDTLGSLDTLLSDTNSDSPIPIATSTSHHSCATKQPLVQSTLPFKPIPRSEWQAQESRRYHEQREENQREADQLALVKEKQKMLRCEHDRARKRAYCARQRRLRDTILPQDKNQGLDTNTVRKRPKS